VEYRAAIPQGKSLLRRYCLTTKYTKVAKGGMREFFHHGDTEFGHFEFRNSNFDILLRALRDLRGKNYLFSFGCGSAALDFRGKMP